MTTCKKYTKEIKQDAVRLVAGQGYQPTQAARNLGIGRGMLGRWVKAFQEDESEAFRGNGKRSIGQEEVRRLRHPYEKLAVRLRDTSAGTPRMTK
jgi:transposase